MSKQAKIKTIKMPTTGKVRFVQPATRRGRKPKIKVLEADDVVKNQVGGFLDFLRERAVVGLAVGIVIGQQLTALMLQVTEGLIKPIVQFLIGTGGDSGKIQLFKLGKRTLDLNWGTVMYALINFLVFIATLYAIIKILKLDKLDKPKA